jgi:hypothetical protein
MKITKKQLRRIIKEEKAKLMAENPDIPDVMGAMGGGKFQPRKEKGHPRAAADNQYVDVLEAVEELLSMRGRPTFSQGSKEDEVYIMTGADEGITVKVLRRGT